MAYLNSEIQEKLEENDPKLPPQDLWLTFDEKEYLSKKNSIYCV